jgi:hypothetical protein
MFLKKNIINDPFQVQQKKHLLPIFENISMNGKPRFNINGGDFINKKNKEILLPPVLCIVIPNRGHILKSPNPSYQTNVS